MSDVLPTGPEALPAPPPAKHGWLNFVIDFGPLLVFFLAYKLSSGGEGAFAARSEEHTSELQSLMRISYAVFCLKKNKATKRNQSSKMISHIIIESQIYSNVK